MHFFFLRTCELIRLMHFFDQHANLSGSCPFFHQRANLSCSCIILFYFLPTCDFVHHHVNLSGSHYFSPPCELIRLTLFFTTVRTYQAYALFHQGANLSGSCTLFRQRANLSSSCTPFSPPCELIRLMHSFSDCWHSDLYPTHARTLWFYGTEWKEPGNIAKTKIMWYRNLAWSTLLGKISNQINLFIH